MSTNPCNIYLVGAQCTGKTTLTNALSAHFEHSLPPESRPGVIKEVARTVLVKHKFTAEDMVSSPDRCLLLQTLILEAQAQAERECLDSGKRWFVADRSGADPLVYAMAYMSAESAIGGGGESLLGTAAWTELRGRLAQSLIVVCEAGMEWLIDDGVRLMPKNMDEWITFHRLFCQFLDKQSLRYVVLPRHMVDIQKRVDFVLSEWRKRGR
ncbi:AAA domain-containing protein [Rhypophila decipiens]|uniref:AAA domain-containing protein n=1 Tax=Rhypophila decipiens TaxID=261697 RepID=A0AAN7BAI9_9PEZI|nr:AAA domain-containing protein [Rhypophila decipiens]